MFLLVQRQLPVYSAAAVKVFVLKPAEKAISPHGGCGKFSRKNEFPHWGMWQILEKNGFPARGNFSKKSKKQIPYVQEASV